MDASLKLADNEISSTFADPLMAERFPPVLTLEQASLLLQAPSRQCASGAKGLLPSPAKLATLAFYRDRLKQAFNEGLS